MDNEAITSQQNSIPIEDTSPVSQAARRRASLQAFLVVVVFLSIAAPAGITGGFLIYENYQRTI